MLPEPSRMMAISVPGPDREQVTSEHGIWGRSEGSTSYPVGYPPHSSPKGSVQ